MSTPNTITTNRSETITPDGGSIVFGDNGLVDTWTVDRDGSDIDILRAIDPDTGGGDTITTGNGGDIVIAGEDGEAVSYVARAGGNVAQQLVAAAPSGDTVVAGNGRNIVLGDNGEILAAADSTVGNRFGSLPIVLLRVTTVQPAIGGGEERQTGRAAARNRGVRRGARRGTGMGAGARGAGRSRSASRAGARWWPSPSPSPSPSLPSRSSFATSRYIIATPRRPLAPPSQRPPTQPPTRLLYPRPRHPMRRRLWSGHRLRPRRPRRAR